MEQQEGGRRRGAGMGERRKEEVVVGGEVLMKDVEVRMVLGRKRRGCKGRKTDENLKKEEPFEVCCALKQERSDTCGIYDLPCII